MKERESLVPVVERDEEEMFILHKRNIILLIFSILLTVIGTYLSISTTMTVIQELKQQQMVGVLDNNDNHNDDMKITIAPVNDAGDNLVSSSSSLLRNNNNKKNKSPSSLLHQLTKKMKHGTVKYTSTMDVHRNITYKRTFIIPCNHGILAFNVGPSAVGMPFMFDVYDDVYAFSNNHNLCLLYPSWVGYQISNSHTFWNPTDPTIVQVPLNSMFRISTHIDIPRSKPTKPVNSTIKERSGDYVIMAKGNFYSPRYYQQLKSLVNGWTFESNIQEELNKFMNDLASSTSTI